VTETVLDRILAHKRAEVAERSEKQTLAALRDRAKNASVRRGFVDALRTRIAAGDPAVIAEVKKASPSRGVIREDFDPVAIARSYANGGAACLSVLTDERFFQGRDDYLVQARAASQLPTLRKDFVIDPYQIYEASVLGADCILLIVAALPGPELGELYRLAINQGLDVLIEVHDARELERATAMSPQLIGINNRDLKTFDTKLSTTYDLLPQIPRDVVVVTESGIHEAAQIASMRTAGVNAFLVGEAFMREADPGGALRRLFFDAK
jgi:indole-3-glycerol phosphate synthase